MKTATILKTTAAVAAGFAISVFAASAPVRAESMSPSVNRDFCRAIGLEPALQASCEEQLQNAASPQQVRDLQDQWAARGAVATRFNGASFYNPPVDDNHLNGTPGTPYQGKPRFVSNQAKAAVQRALKDDDLWAAPVAR